MKGCDYHCRALYDWYTHKTFYSAYRFLVCDSSTSPVVYSNCQCSLSSIYQFFIVYTCKNVVLFFFVKVFKYFGNRQREETDYVLFYLLN